MKILFVFLLSSVALFSQTSSGVYQVQYELFDNGKKTGSDMKIYFQKDIVFLSKPYDKIQHYSDFKSKENISTILYENKTYKTTTSFADLPIPTFEDKNEVILGYNCRYASYMYFSNTVEVWFTEETEVKGSVYNKFVPSNSLVLKIVINNNREIIAKSIEKFKDFKSLKYISKEAIDVTKAEFEELKINSRFTKVKIFENEQINFDPSIPIPKEKDITANKTYRFSKGSVIMKKVKLPKEIRNSEQIFAKLNCKSNGDAYDRTGSVFIVTENSGLSVLNAYLDSLNVLPVYTDNIGNKYQGIRKENNYQPPIEIMRFFTSFGANHFNEKREINNYNWANDVIYKQDVTSLIPIEENEVWIGVFIGNYHKGGHIVSLELNFHPAFNPKDTIHFTRYIQPLFSTINTLEMSGQNYGKLFNNDTLLVNFEVPDKVNELFLLYTSTGHGGWGGGDEFNPKLNQIFIDGKEAFKITPWRTDCATYRLSNPASGNFENGLSSSDFSRSNWCPGTLTPPYFVPLNNLKPGHHVLEVIIDQGDDEGNSFNHWGISGILTGNIYSDK